jgi:cysteinyl-tRNA synthetase
MVYSTLTHSKVRFIPQNKDFVTWYQCGPTVYAESHLGHARTYISLDIIKRVLRDYFNYNIILCQNITDIDDKIIIKSNNNNEDFRALASKYEIEFLDDMKSLGVEVPDMMTRVSEYVTEIIDFIAVIVEKGFAYESEGSVYFDVAKFTAAGYSYAKLSPEAVGNGELMAEGEGALTVSVVKRSSADFALWKKTKDAEKEPSWPSPWGPGRPGWHIECSVMCTEAFRNTLGVTNIDIHAGGVDLKFPHHDNEIAQSEAYHSTHRWVNYWFHTGHLNIDGEKMSKSKKNFTSIRAALTDYTPRQLRLLFLLSKYNAPMDYTEGGLKQATDIDKILLEFIQNLRAELRMSGHIGSSRQHLEDTDNAVFKKITAVKKEIRDALSDDFDTPRAMRAVMDLIREYNKRASKANNGKGLASVTVNAVSKTVLSILRVFGMSQFYDSSSGEAGAGDLGGATSAMAGLSLEQKEQLFSPILNELLEFREKVRNVAKTAVKGGAEENNVKTVGKEILSVTDAIREKFNPLGIRIEDIQDNKSVWKLMDPAELEKEMKQKHYEEEQKREMKLKAQQKAQEKYEQSKIAPANLFRHLTDQYSEFDGEGVPTKDAQGNPLSGGAVKKLKKQFQDQEKLHQKYLESLKEGEGGGKEEAK